MKLNLRSTAIVFTFLANIFWGVGGPLVKIALYDIPPLSFLFLRSLLTVLILLPIFELKLYNEQPSLTWKDKRDIFLAGFLGVFLNIAFYFAGQKLTTVIDAFVIISIGTPFILIFSYLFLKERLSKIAYLGSILAFVGTLVIIGSPILSFGSGSAWGNLLALLATISAALSYILTRKLMTKFSPLLLAFYFFLTSLFCCLPFLLWEFLQNPLWMAHLKITDWLIVFFEAIFSSILAYYLSNRGLKHLSASLASTIGYTSVIISIALSIVFLGEKPTFWFFLGTGVIAVGLLLAETRHKKAR